MSADHVIHRFLGTHKYPKHLRNERFFFFLCFSVLKFPSKMKSNGKSQHLEITKRFGRDQILGPPFSFVYARLEFDS